MVGGIDDPENGPEVAATIFVAVLVYAVCVLLLISVMLPASPHLRHLLTLFFFIGLPCVLRSPGPAASARKPARSDCVVGPTHIRTNGVGDCIEAEATAGAGTKAGAGIGIGTVRCGRSEYPRRHTSRDHTASGHERPERETPIVTLSSDPGLLEPVRT
jgi:hypothetical protein